MLGTCFALILPLEVSTSGIYLGAVLLSDCVVKSMRCSGKKQLAPPVGEMKTMCHLFKMFATLDAHTHTLHTVGRNPASKPCK